MSIVSAQAELASRLKIGAREPKREVKDEENLKKARRISSSAASFIISCNKINQIAKAKSSAMKTQQVGKHKFTLNQHLCLAVILLIPTTILATQNVSAEQQMTHLSHSQNALFKDLSGPTSGKIQTLDVICGKNFMTVRAEFSGPFYGIVFSKGTYGQENCIYVKPNSGLTHAAFNVYYDQCGTKPDLQGKFYENTIVIQYGSDIIEAYDEAKRLRCEWFEAYEKPATFKPAIPVADLEVVEMNFQGDDIDCWMEIQEGAGPWSREVSKIVPVGQPMTIVVAINDYNGQFDMRVKSCVAHDGVQQPIALTDEFGCVLRPKMLTPFTKIKNPGADKKATVLSYSRFLAFKFPDSMTVQIQCTVEVCRHGCAEACQRIPSIAATTLQPELSLSARWPAAPNQPAIEAPAASVRQTLHQQQPQPQQQQQAPIQKPPRFQLTENSHSDSEQPAYKPARVPFTRQPQVGDGGYPRPQSAGNDLSSDEMSGSDSSHQPAVINVRRQQQPTNYDGRVPQYLMPGSRRIPQGVPPTVTAPTTPSTTTTTTSSPVSTESAPSAENSGNRANVDRSDEGVWSSGNEPVSSGGDESTRLSQASEQQVTKIKSLSEQGESAIDNQAQQQADTKADESQVKSTVVSVQQAQPPSEAAATNNQPAQSEPAQPDTASGQVSLESVESVRPSVQGTDEQAPAQPQNVEESVKFSSSSSSSSSGTNTDEMVASGSSPVVSVAQEPAASDSSSSSSKTAEIEPASSSNSESNNQNSFSSVRLPNMDSNSQWGYNSFNNQGSQQQQQQQTSFNKQPMSQYSSEQQVIQPRESINDKRISSSDDSNIEANLMAASNKSQQRFGVRSQSSSQSQAAASVDQKSPAEEGSNVAPSSGGGVGESSLPSNHYNHQPVSSIDAQNSPSPSSEVAKVNPDQESSLSRSGVLNPDRVLIDRSDDSATLTEAGSINSNSESSKSPESSVVVVADESSSLDAGSSGGSRVKPVVGTEELASGPLQLEDRIGSSAPSNQHQQQSESLEEALSRLQQQIPQSAALTANQPQSEATSNEKNSNKPDERKDQPSVQQHENSENKNSQSAQSSNSRMSSISGPTPYGNNNNKKQNEIQLQKVAQNSREVNQPFPNVAGQSKVISDPNSNLNARNSMLAQASNVEQAAVQPVAILPTVSQQQAQAQQPIGQQLPLNVHQQALEFNKHQQQQQQPQQQLPRQQVVGLAQPQPVAQITNVPINIGFPPNQIPPIQQQMNQQLAYFQQQQQQQEQQQQHSKQTTVKPTRGRFNLLSPQAALHAVASRFLPKSHHQQQSQRQLPVGNQAPSLIGSSLPTQQQQQHQQNQNFFLAQQQQPQVAQAQQQFLNQQNRFPAQQQQSGLFARLGNNNQVAQLQQQPLVRSRRSAMMSNGKRGSGEVGITKTFMVVTGLDLAFMPQFNDTELPPILEGRRSSEESEEVIYGICMPVVSLTFVLTCAFWLIVFIFSFCVYMLVKSRRQETRTGSVYGEKCYSPASSY